MIASERKRANATQRRNIVTKVFSFSLKHMQDAVQSLLMQAPSAKRGAGGKDSASARFEPMRGFPGVSRKATALLP